MKKTIVNDDRDLTVEEMIADILACLKSTKLKSTEECEKKNQKKKNQKKNQKK